MALVSSGQLSIGSISSEKGLIPLNASLASLSSTGINQDSALKPNGIAPHSISEFYGYDHNASPPVELTVFNISSEFYPESAAACAEGPFGVTQLYHNGSGETPFAGDTIFDDESGTPFSGQVGPESWYWVADGGAGYSITLNDGGQVNDFVSLCFGRR